MNIAYVRVSTIQQNEERQIKSLEKHNINKWFTEKVSAKDTDRKELQVMLDFVREGDKIYIHSLDRLARNTLDLLQIVEQLNAKGVELISLTDNIDFNSSTGKFMMTILGAVAELERNILKERQLEGIEIAKQKGLYKGRKPMYINADKFKQLYDDWKKGLITQKDMTEELNISRTTLYRRIKEYEATIDD